MANTSNMLSKCIKNSIRIISDSAYTKELKERRRHNNALFRGMYLHEVFYFFREIVCKPMLEGEEFKIHASDIEEGGKFEKFALYSIEQISYEFQCSVYLG